MPNEQQQVNGFAKSVKDFCAAIGGDLDESVIRGVVEACGREPVREAIDKRDRPGLKAMVIEYFGRETLARIGGNSLPTDLVETVVRRVGLGTYAAALANGSADLLRQWVAGTPEAADAPLPPPPASGIPQAGDAPARAQQPVARGPQPPRSSPPPPPGAADPARDRAPAAGSRGTSRPAAPAAGASERRYLQARSYNKGRDRSKGNAGPVRTTSALNFEAVDDTKGNPTIKVEGARGHPTNGETYDWDNKVIFYLTASELRLMLCVMYGYLEEATFNNHGEENNKWLRIKRQADSFYLTMGIGSDYSVPNKISATDAPDIVNLCFRQYQCASYGLSDVVLLETLRRVTAPFAKAVAEAAAARKAN